MLRAQNGVAQVCHLKAAGSFPAPATISAPRSYKIALAFGFLGGPGWRLVSTLVVERALTYCFARSTLSEIEAAADALTPEQKQELFLFLAARLRAQGAKLPEPRKFSREQIAGWIARDEADMQRFREGK